MTAGIASNVYKYFNVDKQNIDNLVLGNSKITFSVKTDWVTQNNAKPEDITLLRYSDGKWNEHTATKVNADGNYYYYESTIPGFSTFAISLKGKTIEDSKVEQPLIENQVQPKQEVEPIVEEQKNSLWYVWLLVLVIILAVVYLVIRNRQKDHKPQGKKGELY